MQFTNSYSNTKYNIKLNVINADFFYTCSIIRCLKITKMDVFEHFCTLHADHTIHARTNVSNLLVSKNINNSSNRYKQLTQEVV